MDCKYTVPAHVSDGCRRLIGRMLQRDPANRANLDEIANDPWLSEGAPALQPAHYLPLVSREHLSEDDHALILQKMVNGNIANKEEIVDALDKDEYNNITATYFLLAERKLRAQRQEQALMLSRGQPPPPPPPPPIDDPSPSTNVRNKRTGSDRSSLSRFFCFVLFCCSVGSIGREAPAEDAGVRQPDARGVEREAAQVQRRGGRR